MIPPTHAVIVHSPAAKLNTLITAGSFDEVTTAYSKLRQAIPSSSNHRKVVTIEEAMQYLGLNEILLTEVSEFDHLTF